MEPVSRREFLGGAGASLGLGWRMARAAGALGLGMSGAHVLGQEPGERPPQRPVSVKVINPRARVPMSLIIDDSTCLVNLAHFCIPQFQEVFPDEYPQPWKTLPREIPDAFVRKFAAWCREHGVMGKYSVIPHPACVGWLDRDMPGWSKQELKDSLEVVRTTMLPDWDIHPEMVSHTWVIDTRTGRPYPERTARFMENWGWTEGKSADQLATYMAYALRVLREVGLPCTGITTPGGFGNQVLPELAQGVLQACRDIFQAEIPHYFRHVFTDERSVAPRVEYASGLGGNDPRCVVSIIGCTSDWFGGWDGLTPGRVDQFITEDFKGGRLPEIISRGEPTILVCHWPGIYFNGMETGFNILKEVVQRLHTAYDHLVWMKQSAIARYWAARELTRIERTMPKLVDLHAPYACPGFTVEITSAAQGAPPRGVGLGVGGATRPLKAVASRLALDSGTFYQDGDQTLACFDLPKGPSRLVLE